jgi:glycosyltransferase involved in cell wall biosynthesis
MKNIYIIDYASSKTNGIGSYIRELTYCLLELGTNVCLIVLNYETDRFSITYENKVKKILFPPIKGSYFNKYMTFIFFLRLYINDSSNNFFLINHGPCEFLLKSLKESFPKSKTIFVIHDMGWTFEFLGDIKKLNEMIRTMDSKETNNKYKNLIDHFCEEQRMYKIVDKIIVLAKETEDLLKERYVVDEQKLFYIPNGLRDSYTQLDNEKDKMILKQKLYLNKNEKIILYTGRNVQVKGSYQLLNCFEKVLQQYPDCRLVIVGSLFEPHEILKHSSNIAAKITYTGQITSEKVREWYRVADIGILPSYLEQCSYTGAYSGAYPPTFDC